MCVEDARISSLKCKMIKYVIEPQMGFDAFEIDSLKMCICYIFGLYHILSGVYWSYIYVGRINIVRVSARYGYSIT